MQVSYEQHIPNEGRVTKSKTKQTQEPKTCTPKIQGVSRDPTGRPKEDLASGTQNSPHVRVSRVKKDAGVQPTTRRTS